MGLIGPRLTPEHRIPLPPGTIITPQGEQARFGVFYASLLQMIGRYPNAMLNPDGSPRIRWVQGVDIAFNMNHALRNLYPDSQWAWIIGDDHIWQPDLIERLWQRQVDIVAPLCLKRSTPHTPVQWDLEMKPIPMGESEAPHLKQVGIAGGAGMLISIKALEMIGDPWFRFLPTNTERWGEDIWFCRRAAEVGLPVYVDSEVVLGHINHVQIWPKWDPEKKKWLVEYRMHGQCEVM
jgi:hypothetical protein